MATRCGGLADGEAGSCTVPHRRVREYVHDYALRYGAHKVLTARGRVDTGFTIYGLLRVSTVNMRYSVRPYGLSVGRHGLLGKQNMFDHSIRVPLLMVGPDIPKKHKIDQEVYLQDIMATSLELANVKPTNTIEFNSLLSTAKGTSQEKIYKNGIYGAYIDYQRMIRKDGFKLIIYPKIKKTVLFDLKNDPLEINDLSTNVSYIKKKTDLFTGLLSLQKKFGDPLDLSSLVP